MLFFGYFFAHVGKAWPAADFGTAVGLVSVVASGVAFGLAQPLARVAFRTAKGAGIVAAALIPCLLLTHVLNERAAAKIAALRSADVQLADAR